MSDEHEAASKVSRRGFLSGAVGAMAGGTLLEAGAETLPAAQAPDLPQTNQELRTDVVAVGSGMGGLTAALQAQRSGARVIVLEKASEPGGTTAYSNGHVQHRTYDTMRLKVPEGDPDVQRTVAENISKWDRLMDVLEAPIGPRGRVPGSDDVSTRLISPPTWVNFMVGTIESGGGKVLVATPMIRLLTNHLNEIIGVLADGPRGVIRIYAKAVVLATGGWASNAQLMQANISRYFASMRQRNAAGAGKPPFLGDGLFAALQLGGQLSTGGFDSFYGYLTPARPAEITERTLYISCSAPHWVVAVNRFGRRFTDEAQGKLSGRQINHQGGEFCGQEVARQPDAMAAYIFDEATYKKYACDYCALGDTGDYVRFKNAGAPTAKADTLPELARQMEAWGVGMVADTLLRELTEYNQAARNGKAWALPVPKTSAKHAIPLTQSPFYAILGQAGIVATQGGIRVNTMGQVLHRGGRPIPGLYAAGIDIGNFSNYAYLGNLNLGAAFGYVSGTNAAKQSAPKGGWGAAPGNAG